MLAGSPHCRYEGPTEPGDAAESMGSGVNGLQVVGRAAIGPYQRLQTRLRHAHPLLWLQRPSQTATWQHTIVSHTEMVGLQVANRARCILPKRSASMSISKPLESCGTVKVDGKARITGTHRAQVAMILPSSTAKAGWCRASCDARSLCGRRRVWLSSSRRTHSMDNRIRHSSISNCTFKRQGAPLS
jgi:hypothetical protein